MSDFSLVDIVNLIRAEIARTEIGDTKKITGPAGEQGSQGEAGIQGPQGPRGNDGKQGPIGAKGNQGKKGDKGIKGDDGTDGVGIARVEQDIDNAIVVHLTDGNYYTIEMPLINPDGSLAREVHYKSGGGSGSGDGSSGTVDLSGYVRRPGSSLQGSWLVYKEESNGSKTWTPVTTDLVAVNPNPFRDAKGKFAPTPQELENINNQRDVNEFLYEKIQQVEGGEIDLDGYATETYVDDAIDAIPATDLTGYATEVQLNEVDLTSQMRDEVLDSKIDQESNLNTAAHLKLEDQILRCYAWSEGDNEKLERQLTKVDEDLQEQITENKDASESGDRQLQSEIEQVALALETLLVQREHGQWKYVGFSGDNIPRNAGEFALISDDLSSNDNIITLNQEDLKGITHGFGDVEVGDYVEIVDFDEPASYVLFVVTKAPEGTGIVNVEVALKDKGQNILIGETCEIRFFQVNEQDIALEDLDDRFVNVSGDTMNGRLRVNGPLVVNQPTQVAFDILGDGGNSKIKFWSSGAVALQDYTAFKDNELVTKKYVDDKVDSSAGGKLELPKFKLMTNDAVDGWDLGLPSNPGDLAFLNVGGYATSSIAQTRSIVFAGKALDGSRCARDKDAKEYKRSFGTNFSVLDESGEKTLMSMSGAHNALCEVGYLASYDGVFYDLYQITWQSLTSSVVNSNIELWKEGHTYQLYIPELFF